MRIYLVMILSVLAFTLQAGETMRFKASLSPQGIRPALAKPPKNSRGSIEASLKGSNLTVEGSYSYLTSNAQAIQVNGPADVEATADAICSFKPKYNATNTPSFGKLGECSLNAEQIDALKAGKLYIIITTLSLPAGEVRGQLTSIK